MRQDRRHRFTQWLVIAMAAMFCMLPPVLMAEETTLREQPEKVAAWNRFARQLETLHHQQIALHPVRMEIREGGYQGEYFNDPDYYIEERYYTLDGNRLVSVIRREKDNPDNIHTIEVNVLDKQGRVMRDYLAAYLPWGHNAPIQTLVNLHHYSKHLHSFRQFDASGNRIYEQCQGRHKGKEINISLESPEIEAPRILKPDYRACFGDIQLVAGKYLTPQ